MSSTTQDMKRFSALIERIYDGAIDPNVWPETLVRIAEACNSSKALLFTPMTLPQQNGFAFSHGFSPDDLELYLTKYVHMDVWGAESIRQGLVRHGTVIIGSDVVTDEQFYASQVYHEFAKRIDAVRLMTTFIFDGMHDGEIMTACSVLRGEREPRYDEESRRLYQMLVPHLSRAFGVMYRLRGAEVRVAATLSALDKLTTPVLLIAPPGVVVFANSAAHTLLERGDGLSLRKVGSDAGDYLSASDSTAQQRLDFAMHQVVDGEILDIAHFANSISVPRRSGLQPYAVQFSALPEQNEFGEGIVAPRAIAFISDPAAPLAVEPASLSTLYHLTKAEVRLVIALSDGSSVEEAARQVGVQPSTAKSQLQSIYTKMGVDNRAKLVKMLLTLSQR